MIRRSAAIGGMRRSVRGPLVTLSPEATAFFVWASANGAPVPDARKPVYDRLFTSLVYSGVLAKLDGLYVVAGTAALMRQNLVQDAFHATAVGSPTFVADQGYTGANGAGKYLDTGFDPTVGTPHYQRNSNSLFAWKNAQVVGDNGGLAGLFPSRYLDAYTDAKLYTDMDIYNGIADNPGLFGAVRTGANAGKAYISGIPMQGSASTASAAFTAGQKIQILNDGLGQNDGSTCQVSAAAWGGALTDAEARNLYIALQNYLDEIHAVTPVVKLGFTSDVVSDGAANWEPGLGRLLDGRLFCAYAVAPGATQVDVKIVYKTSANNGRTWSAATDIVVPAAGFLYGAPRVAILPDGMILIGCMYEPNSYATSVVRVIRGTVAGDLSITFGAPINVPSAVTVEPATASAILQLLDGRLMFGFYVWQGVGLGVRVVFSSDAGLTWGSEVAVLANGASVYNESSFVQFANGEIVGIVRVDSHGYQVVRSVDAGATWTKDATQIYTAAEAPESNAPGLAITPSESLFFMSRFQGTGGPLEAAYMRSTDRGATFSPPVIYFNVDLRTYGMSTQQQALYDATRATIICAQSHGGYTLGGRVIYQEFALS